MEVGTAVHLKVPVPLRIATPSVLLPLLLEMLTCLMPVTVAMTATLTVVMTGMVAVLAVLVDLAALSVVRELDAQRNGPR